MRIAYGVMGYGRGHAMRTATVLPHLMEQHDVRVFASADAYKAVSYTQLTLPTILRV